MLTQNELLNYKGYNALITADPVAEILQGEVVDLNDSLTFEGENFKQLKENFEKTVDAYLEVCEEVGKTPDKPFSGKLAFRTDAETHRKIFLAAKQQRVSVNAWMDARLRCAAENEVGVLVPIPA